MALSLVGSQCQMVKIKEVVSKVPLHPCWMLIRKTSVTVSKFDWLIDWFKCHRVDLPLAEALWAALSQFNSIYQSINQISIAPITPAKPGSVAQQPNQCSTAKLKKQLCNINRPSGMLVSMGDRPSQRCVFRCFLRVAAEMAEWTDSGRLFQRDGVQEWKALESVLVLTLGTDRQINTFVWFQWTGWKWCGKHGVKVDRLFFMQGFVGKLNWS